MKAKRTSVKKDNSNNFIRFTSEYAARIKKQDSEMTDEQRRALSKALVEANSEANGTKKKVKRPAKKK